MKRILAALTAISLAFAPLAAESSARVQLKSMHPAPRLPVGPISGGGLPVGSAGNPSNSVITTQGITNGTPLPVTGAPNIITTGTIFAADSNQICSNSGWGQQTACVGTPSANSAVQVPINSAGYIWIQGITTGGTPTVNFALRISNDGGTTWFNRGIFAITNVAPFQINNIANDNFAGWMTGGVTNVEVVATSYSGAGSTAIVITQGQAAPLVTSSATSSSLNGSGSSAATNVQGNGTAALPVNTDTQQEANTTLAPPTAPGSSTTGNVRAVQGVTNGVPMPTSNATNVSPTSCSPSSALVANTPVNLPNLGTSAVHGFMLQNIDATTGGGEAVWVSFVGTASIGGQDSFALPPPQSGTTMNGAGSFTAPPWFGTSHAVSVVVATSGHKLSCVLG